MKTRRGDVVLVLFPNSDLRTAKRRPALVLRRDNLGVGLEQTIVAMISSNLARRDHPSRVFISAASREGKTAGVRLDSVVMTDNLATVLERYFYQTRRDGADNLQREGSKAKPYQARQVRKVLAQYKLL
jgi:mRNA interferase MazF